MMVIKGKKRKGRDFLLQLLLEKEREEEEEAAFACFIKPFKMTFFSTISFMAMDWLLERRKGLNFGLEKSEQK